MWCRPSGISRIWKTNQGEGSLLFLLSQHVGPNNELLDGEVENQRSDRGVEHGARQELVSQVNRKEISLAGSVQSANGRTSSLLTPEWPLIGYDIGFSGKLDRTVNCLRIVSQMLER